MDSLQEGRGTYDQEVMGSRIHRCMYKDIDRNEFRLLGKLSARELKKKEIVWTVSTDL